MAMNKPKVLFLHGFMGQPKEGLFLEEFGSLWAPDLLELSLDSDECMKAFYKAIEDYNPSLLYGYSLGGRIALNFLDLNPEYKGEVVIESASLPLTDPAEKENRSIVDHQRSREIREDYPLFLENWYQAPLWGELSVVERDILKEEKLERFKSKEDLEALANFLLFFSPAHFPKESYSIKQTLIYLYGEQDLKYKNLGEFYQSSHPHWTIHEVAKAGHNIHSLKETQLLEYIRSFLSR